MPAVYAAVLVTLAVAVLGVPSIQSTSPHLAAVATAATQ